MEPLQLEERHLEEILEILKTHLPNIEIWAYGSRARGDAGKTSDLDLVARNHPDCNQRIDRNKLIDIRDAFSESNIPFFVQIFDWASVPEDFKPNILRDKKILISAPINL